MSRFWDRPVPVEAFKRRRVILVVEADLDQMPGFLHEPDDWAKWIANKLNYLAASYRPEVRAVAVEHTDGTVSAIL